MADMFDNSIYGVFEHKFKEIKKEYDTIISVFGGDLYTYITNTETPFNVSVPIQVVADIVDKHTVELAFQVKTILSNLRMLDSLMSDFIKYYSLLSEIETKMKAGDTSDEFKSSVIIAVLIFLGNNDNLSKKKVRPILKSACVMPDVTTLVNSSATVLSYCKDTDSEDSRA